MTVRESQSTWRETKHAREEHVNSTQKGPCRDSIPPGSPVVQPNRPISLTYRFPKTFLLLPLSDIELEASAACHE